MPGPNGILSLLPDESYPEYWRFVWGAAVTGLDPDSAKFSAYSDALGPGLSAIELYKATATGDSPHKGMTGVDPSSVLTNMQSRVTDLKNAVDALFMDAQNKPDIATYINGAFTNALANYANLGMETLAPTTEVTADLEALAQAYDTHVAAPADVDSLVDAIDEASKRHYLRDVARVTAGMFDVRAVMGSQLGFMVANLENIRASEAAEAEARLRAVALREKGAHVTQLAGQLLDAKLQNTIRTNQMKSALVLETVSAQLAQTPILLTSMLQLSQAQLAYGQYDVAVRQDMLQFGLEQSVRDKLWKWEMFSYFQQGVAMHGGAMPLPRAQTPMERVAGAVMSGLGVGLGVGLINPALGVAAGIATTALHLFAAPWKIG